MRVTLSACASTAEIRLQTRSSKTPAEEAMNMLWPVGTDDNEETQTTFGLRGRVSISRRTSRSEDSGADGVGST